MTLLSIENLSIEYVTPRGVVRAVDGISFKVPRGKVIGVVGDISADELALRLDEMFGALPAASALSPIDEAETAGAGKTLVVERNIPQSVVVFGHPGVKRDDPDYYTASVMVRILGGGGGVAGLGPAGFVYCPDHQADEPAGSCRGTRTQGQAGRQEKEKLTAHVPQGVPSGVHLPFDPVFVRVRDLGRDEWRDGRAGDGHPFAGRHGGDVGLPRLLSQEIQAR